MRKLIISLTLSQESIDLINDWPNKSDAIDRMIQRTCATEEGIMQEMDEETIRHNDRMAFLGRKLDKIKALKDNYLQNIPEGLKLECAPRSHFENGQQIKNPGLKELLRKHPDKMQLWTGLTNKKYNQNYTPEQLKKIVEKWG